MGLCDSSWQFLRTKTMPTRSEDLLCILEQWISRDLQQHLKQLAGALRAAIPYLWALFIAHQDQEEILLPLSNT